MTTHPPMLEGWLKKKGDKGLIKAPKLRFFMQSGTNLEYFIEKNTFSPQGYIDLKKISNVFQKSPTSFHVISTTGRTYQLEIVVGMGNDDKPIDYWINGFKEWQAYFAKYQLHNDQKRDSKVITRESIDASLKRDTKETVSNAESNTSTSNITSKSTSNISSNNNTNTNSGRRQAKPELILDSFPSPPKEQSPQSNPFVQSPSSSSNTSLKDLSSVSTSSNPALSDNSLGTIIPVNHTPLWSLVKDGNENNLKQYLNQSKIRLKNAEPFQMSVLHYAVVCGTTNIIKTLIVNGVPATIYDSAGQTPLLYAIEKHQGPLSTELVDMLLNCGANPNEGDKVNEFSPLNAACLAGNVNIVRSLLLRGVNLNQEDKRLNWSPLHWACAGGSLQVVRYLVTEKEIKFQNKNPTPRMIAVKSGFMDIAEFLNK